MKTLSRRDFLKYAGLGAASSILLTACGEAATTSSEADTVSEAADQEEVKSAADAAIDASDTTDEIDGDYSVLKIGVSSLNKTLAPNNASEWYSELIYPAVAKTNVLTGDSAGILAKNVEYSDDMLTMNVELYDNIVDTAGNHITAEDVIYCWDQALAAGAMRIRDFSDWEQTGEYTCSFGLKSVPHADGQPISVYIYSKKAYEESPDGFATTAISCGPYKLKSFTTDYNIIIEKNEEFWYTDEQTAKLKEAYGDMYSQRWETIEFWQINESMQMTVALETGTIDYSAAVDAQDLYLFEDGGADSDNFNVYEYVSGLTYALVYNTDPISPLSDVNVRKAVSYAIDSSYLIETVKGGKALETHEVGAASLTDYNPDWMTEDNYYNVDLNLSKSLLADAGYPDGLELTYLASSSTEAQNIGVVLQSQLKQVGISLELLTVDHSIMNQYMEDDHGSWDINLTQAGSEDFVWNAWLKIYKQGSHSWEGTLGYYVDEEMQAMLDLCASKGNDTRENLDAFHDYVTERCLVYALYNAYSNCVLRSDLSLALSPNGKDTYFNAFYYHA